MIYRIAVCDDQQTDRDYLASLLNEWAVSVGHIVQPQLFPSAEAFLFCYEVAALHYLVKTIRKDKLFAVLDHPLIIYSSDQNNCHGILC
ncbi:MAG: hypothetical protein J1D87_11070 [Lachnospiraceae bacterium]|nr:hypothetical protein [Lachnospiraceae bacterium]